MSGKSDPEKPSPGTETDRAGARPRKRKGEGEKRPGKRAGRQAGDFPVVGIGASAGGMKALRELLGELPTDTGMAFVLIQHLNPSHESSLAEILAKATEMAVRTAEDRQPLKPDTLSVIPPGYGMTLEGRTLRLEKREKSAGTFQPIDRFFLSLAEELGDKAVAVVLSGSSADGARGVIEVRAAGGLTLVQSEASAEYSSMPHQALLTDKVDFCGSPAEIGRMLGEIASHPGLYPEAFAERATADEDEDEGLERILLQLRRTGVDFSQYKQNTVRRRILRRMALARISSLGAYARHLEDSEAELAALKEDLLIKVTSFFRDPETFETLKKEVFPSLVKGRDEDHPLRIWVPGCATGEEVYSLAMSLIEFLGERTRSIPVQIFGTDLSDSAIEKARRGCFSSAEVADLGERRRERFFAEEEEGYRVKRLVRDMCVFARQDFTRDPPFSHLDLISCRNVLIYLGPLLQKRVVPLFHYALRNHGYLLLGQSESIGQFDGIFSLVDSKARIYRKKADGEMPDPEFWPSRTHLTRAREQTDRPPPQPNGNGENRETDLEQEVNRLLLRKYEPAAVVIDRSMQILHFRGDTGPYLQPAPGRASLDLLKMTRPPLSMELRALVHLASKEERPKVRDDLRVTLPGGERLVRLEVTPFTSGEDKQCFFVEFHSRPSTLDDAKSHPDAPGAGTDLRRELGRLERELTASHVYQQSLIEEKENALEELKTANEEILSSNEELQSINEELETAKEELESSNEELSTVNQELQDRNDQLIRTNDDLSNLILSAEIPFVIVTGEDLVIRRIGPTAAQYLNIRSSDVGRPLGEIKLPLEIRDLDASLHQVMASGKPQEEEIHDAEGRWRLLRLRPYQTADERIEGAVMTLVDIDRLKQSMTEVERAYQYALHIVEAVKVPLLVLDDRFRVQTANPAFFQKFRLTPERTEGVVLFELADGPWNLGELKRLLKDVLPKNADMDDFLIEFDFPLLGRRSMLISARPIHAREKKILLSIEDVTERLTLERALRQAKRRAEAASQAKSEFLATMSHEIRTPMTIILAALQHLERAELQPDQDRCVHLAGKAGAALMELIGDILDFSKIEARRLTLENRAFDLHETVEEAVSVLRGRAEEKGLELDLEIDGGVPETVRGDQSRLRQVLTNLVGNAIKFTDEGRVEVTLGLRPEEGPAGLLFRIRDTGCGIPADKLDVLFQSFSQVDSSSTRRHGGTGLGLAICKGIVERMGGRIWVESAEGEGSTFFFTLPWQAGHHKAPEPAPPPAPPDSLPADCRILLVEDDADCREVIRLGIEEQGWSLTLAASGEEAVEAWRKGDYHLILMDLQMGRMDGLDATRLIRGLEPPGRHVSIVALTAHASDASRSDCLAAGMDEVLVKPLRTADLHRVIARFC